MRKLLKVCYNFIFVSHSFLAVLIDNDAMMINSGVQLSDPINNVIFVEGSTIPYSVVDNQQVCRLIIYNGTFPASFPLFTSFLNR